MLVPFSILDLAQIVEGGTAAESFASSLALAQSAEALGYSRVWYAEHHNIPNVASSATSVLIAHIAAHTKTIRLGAGGVMLPNHAPLLIAEQFGTLESLHPGRIDLGLGRAPGGDREVIRALRKDFQRGADNFPADVETLMAYLAKPTNPPRMPVRAIPGEGTDVPIWILGSSLAGAQLAARLGLPYAFASHFAPDYLLQAAALYRRDFLPSVHLDTPYFMLACNVFAADTDAQAHYHFSSLVQAFVGLVTNQRRLTQPPVENLEVDPQIATHLERMLKFSAVGSVSTVAKQLSMFQHLVEPNEIIIAKNFFDQDARLRSLELTMQSRDLMT